jgi:hypothetical protein
MTLSGIDPATISVCSTVPQPLRHRVPSTKYWGFSLTLRLWTGYKMYPGLEFCWTFLTGAEKQSYQFFCLFTEVLLTQPNHHSAHIHCFFTCGLLFFLIQLDHFVLMLVKNVSNTRSAITYYVNSLTHKNWKRVTTTNPTAQLTD